MTTTATTTTTTTRILASMDTGVDDALALAYLAASPNCELIGVIGTYGNVDAPTAVRNTRHVLALLGRDDVPVHAGSAHPSWADVFLPDAGCAAFHGADGLGGFGGRGDGDDADADDGRDGDGAPSREGGPSGVPATAAVDATDVSPAADAVVSVGGYPWGDPHANPAGPPSPTGPDAGVGGNAGDDGIGFLVDQVRRHGRGLTVLATGPLTDVDEALRRAPDIAPRLRLVLMGGALTQPGNCWDAVAETNVLQDPQAADRVFHSGADVTMVGLDVTHRCLLGSDATRRWREAAADGDAALRFLADVADFSIAANLRSDPALFARGMPLHDPLAAAVALDPTLVTTVDLALRAETRTADGCGVRGRTVGDPLGLVDAGMPRVHVALDVDAERFLRRFTDRLASLAGASAAAAASAARG